MKTWLITGCSSGLGKGLAEAVLEHGDQAVVTARRPETLRHFTDRYPGTALALPLDVSDDAQAEAAVKAALARFGRVDVLASVAGYCLRGAVEECSMDEIHRQFETNFFGTVRMIRKVLPSMRAVRNGPSCASPPSRRRERHRDPPSTEPRNALWRPWPTACGRK